ncbi:hypothetical protein GGQ91_001009 [Methylobacterium fujisawaense]|uniref:Uncharacterized protein n=1 Tax=Methylobacterium fujisawaense TaxID=107400 RepID=A0ABR6D7A0_9HYPH|nr:hypothetical protein [Methylobacterium fujisawaense]
MVGTSLQISFEAAAQHLRMPLRLGDPASDSDFSFPSSSSAGERLSAAQYPFGGV